MSGDPADPRNAGASIVSTAGRADVTPGRTTDIAIHVANNDRESRSFEIRPVGLDEQWAASNLVVGPLGPGEAVDATLAVTLPTGFPACELTAGLAVQPLDAAGGPVGAPSYVDLVFVVGDGSKVTATLEPTDVEGGDGGRFHVVLRNRSASPIPVELKATAPGDKLRFRFAQSSVVLPAGHEVRVRTKVRGRRRMTGAPQRLPFVIRVQGRTTPVLLDGSFTQRPTLSGTFTKVLAVVVVIALWVSMATFGLGKLTNRLHSKSAKAQTAAAPVSGGDTTDGGGPPGGTTSAAAGAAGKGGAAGAKGGAAGAGAGQTAGATAVKVSGKVTGKDPGGVAVTLAPTSLVDEKAQGASFNGGGPTTSKIGKVFGQLIVATTSQVVSDTRSTSTANDGSWAFGSVRAPGFYLVTFSKAGFATRKSIVSADDTGKPIELQVPLVAGNGTIGGLINDGTGAPLGGVDITITDGTVTLGTRTPTTGDVGRWSVNGLTTPGTYLVTSTRRGFGTQTTLVTLSAGQSSPDVALTMKQGTASITGKVSSAEGPVAGAVVTLTDGTTTRHASTLTVGSVGSYILPELPVPGSYSLTVAGDGWTTQTQRIDLTDNASVDTVLTRTTGDVTGIVLGADGKGLVGAGVTLSNDTFKLKTTTVSNPPGSYALTGVPPGSYVVTFEQFGKISQVGAVQVGQGTVGNLNSTLPTGDPNNVPLTARVSGHVIEFRTGAILGQVDVTTTDVDPPKTVATNGQGDYVITDLPPGVHHLKVTSANHEPVTVTATVGVGGVAFANQAELPAEGVINGLVSSNAGGTVANELVQVLTFDNPPAVVASTMTKPDGTYTIGGLVHGHYHISFSGDPTFEHRDVDVPLDMAQGEVKSFPIGLDRRGRLNLSTQTPGADGGLLALPGIEVTAVDAAGKKFGTTTGSNGQAANQALITGLEPGPYTVTFTEPSAAHHTDSVQLNVSLNTTTAYEAVLLGNTDDVSGAVEWTKDGVTIAIPNATVSMTGIIAYDTDSAGHRIPHRQTFVTTTDNAGSFFFPHAKVPLIVETADFNVTAINFSSLSTTGTKVFGGAVKAFETMTPLPSEFDSGASAVTLTQGTHTDPFSVVTATVLSAPPGVSGVQVRVDPASGHLTWADPSIGSNQVKPGTYSVQFTADHYDPVVVPLKVELGKSVSISATLLRHGSIIAAAMSNVTGTAIPGASITLQGVGTKIADGSGIATFGDLSVTGNPYQVSVGAAGFAVNATAVKTDVVPGVDNPSVTSVALHKQGSITGTLAGQVKDTVPLITNKLGNVVVTATGQATGVVATATTDGNGRFVILGPAPADPSSPMSGLPADTYTLTAKSTGYSELSKSVVVLDGNDVTVDPDLTKLTATTVKLSVSLDDGAKDALSGATVTAFSSQLGQTRTATESLTKPGSYDFGDLPPVQYTLNLSLVNHSSLSLTINLQVGSDSISLPETLVPLFNKVTGNITATIGTTAVGPLQGVATTITPLDGKPLPKEVVHLDSDGTGSYSITGLPDGSYKIDFSKAGYTTVSQSIIVRNGQILSLDAVLPAATHTVPVHVTSPVDGKIAGATVTLTPLSSSTGVTQTAQTVADGTATFSQLLPGTYDATITATSHVTTTKTSFYKLSPGDADPIPTQNIAFDEERISGTNNVTDASPIPLKRPEVSVTITNKVTGKQVAAPTEDGAFSWSVYLPPADYKVVFSVGSGYADDGVEVLQTDLKNAQAVIAGTVVRQLATLDILVVTDTDDSSPPNKVDPPTPVTDATVVLTPDDGSFGPITMTTPKTGNTYVFTNLPPVSTTYTVTVTRTGPPKKTGDLKKFGILADVDNIPPNTPTTKKIIIE